METRVSLKYFVHDCGHSLTALVQRNHQLVVLPYLKLPFELHSYYCAHIDKHSPLTTGCCTNLLLSRFSCELAVLFLEDFRASHCGSKHRSSPSVFFNQTVFSIYMISKKLYLNLSKYVETLLVVKTFNKY